MYMSSSNRKADSGEASVLPEVSRDGRSMVWRKELRRGQGCRADRQMQNLRCLPRCLRGEFVVPLARHSQDRDLHHLVYFLRFGLHREK